MERSLRSWHNCKIFYDEQSVERERETRKPVARYSDVLSHRVRG